MDTPSSNTPPPPGSQPPPPGGQPPNQPSGVPPQQFPPQQPPPQQAPPPNYPAQPGPYPQQPGYAAPPGSEQPGYPQPGYGQPPLTPQPKKKSKWWIWVLAILFVFALLIGGCGFLVFRAVTGPIDKANEFLALLEDGEVEDATDLLDFDCFTNEEIDEVEEFFTTNPVESYDLDNTSNENGRGSASGTVTLSEGLGVQLISFDLTNDDGWQICGINVDEP